MPSASTDAKRDKHLTLRSNDLISVAECNAMIRKHLRQFWRRILVLLSVSVASLALIAVLAVWAAK